MKYIKHLAVLAVASAFFAPTTDVSAQPFFENFDSGTSGANWNVNLGAGNNAANLAFDYSTIGIPSAPHSIGGSTIGAKLEANFGPTTGSTGGVSISPIGQGFSGNYEIKYDMWINFNGELTAGGSGSTQLAGVGIGSTGTQAITVGSPAGGVWFGATGDGGNGDVPGDYRAYASGAALATTTGAYYAGTQVGARNDTDAYYQALGGVGAPAAQIALFSQQTNTTRAGAAGMAWHQITVTVTNGIANYKIDNLDIAKVDISALTLSTNIFFLQSDINTGVSTDPNRRDLSFGLIDNVSVVAVPEPSTIALGLMGVAGAIFALRRRK